MLQRTALILCALSRSPPAYGSGVRAKKPRSGFVLTIRLPRNGHPGRRDIRGLKLVEGAGHRNLQSSTRGSLGPPDLGGGALTRLDRAVHVAHPPRRGLAPRPMNPADPLPQRLPVGGPGAWPQDPGVTAARI